MDPRIPRRFGPPSIASPPTLAPPPRKLDATGQSSVVQPLMMTAGMLGGLVFFVISPNPLYIFAGLLFAIGSVGGGVAMAVSQRRGPGKRLTADRARYLDAVVEARSAAAAEAVRHHELSWRVHPAPAVLAGALTSDRAFERRRSDDDFLRVRIGRGAVRNPAALRGGAGDGQIDTVAAAVAGDVLDGSATVGGMPVTIGLREVRICTVDGDAQRAAAMVRAMVAQISAWHAPGDVRLLIGCAPQHAADWEWTRWLPHSRPGTGDTGTVFTDRTEFTAVLTGELIRRYEGPPSTGAGAVPELVVIADGLLPDPASAVALLGNEQRRAATLVVLGRDELAPRPRWRDLGLTVTAAGRVGVDAGGACDLSPGSTAHADRLALDGADVVARAAARAADRNGIATPSEQVEVRAAVDLLGVPMQSDGTHLPEPRSPADLLRTPIGRTEDGDPVWLDLKESAAGGIGPHGVIVGATGSGKSELLRTLVVGLALRHPPEQLSFVLADFKGGAAFAGLAELPHVAGVITNLADDSALVGRMFDALHGEHLRRQELLHLAGDCPTIGDYQAARLRSPDAGLPPMPHLLLIVDEVSELLTARPDFADLFLALGRQGRSLGVHLLLASQRLDEGRLRGLESHLSYRIALRTFSSEDSSAVLGVPDAYHLPAVPGWAYLKSGTELFQRFRAVSMSAPADVLVPRTEQNAECRVLGRLTADGRRLSMPAPEHAEPVAAEPTVDGAGDLAGRAVTALHDPQRRTHQVWLPPLPPALSLGALVGSVEQDEAHGLHTPWPADMALKIPVGLLDLPRAQRFDVALLDLAGAAGGVQIVGAPQTGKTTFLRTLALSLALTHTPDEVQIHCLDLSGGLRDLQELPHVGDVVGRTDRDRVQRLLDHLLRTVDRRAAQLAERGIESITQARTHRVEHPVGSSHSLGPFPDVFVFVDSALDLRTEFDADDQLTQLVSRGLAVGVHVVVTATRYADLRPAVRELLGTRIELRLGDPADSMVDRVSARGLPPDVPGRAVMAPGVIGQIALSDLAGPAHPESVPLRVAAELAAEQWTGRTAQPVRMLPTAVRPTELPLPGADPLPGVPVGLGEPDLDPVYLDLTGHEQHVVAFGDGESGKTSLLKVILDGLGRRTTPDQARIQIVDYRRGLLDFADARGVAGYAASAPAADEMVRELCTTLADRLPGSDVTAADLRSRSWWTGPEMFLVVDDYDLVDANSGNPLAPLVDFLPQARDIGLHLVLARRSSGASRAMYSTLISHLHDFGATAILLSGDPGEGALFGDVRMRRQPPGRATVVRRRSVPTRCQLALPEPPPEEPVLAGHTARPPIPERSIR